jgi:23S rRNA (cytosine1962-C5)-methyltransferase
VWRGHPWVYSGAVERVEGQAAAAEPGALADVLDADGRLIGCGFLNARSQIAVRMLTRTRTAHLCNQANPSITIPSSQ